MKKIVDYRKLLNVDKNAELPTGTYFYIIQYNDGNGKVVSESKYLYLTR